MYGKFAALAFIISKTSAQDDYDEPAPMPWFREDPNFYSMITFPDDESFGDFKNNIAHAGFAMWVDTDNTDLTDWIDSFNWKSVDFPKPNYEVFGGGVIFDNEPTAEEKYSTCLYMEEYDPTVWCAGVGGFDGEGWVDVLTYTFDPKDLPTEDGVLEDFAPDTEDHSSASGNF